MNHFAHSGKVMGSRNFPYLRCAHTLYEKNGVILVNYRDVKICNPLVVIRVAVSEDGFSKWIWEVQEWIKCVGNLV